MTASQPTKHAMILDTDPGIDDLLAILQAMGSPSIDLKAITLTYGNTNIKHVTRNLFTILAILSDEVNPERVATISDPAKRARLEAIAAKRPAIAVGSDKPLVHKDVVYGEDFHGPDGLGGVHLDDPDLAPANWAEIFDLLEPTSLGLTLEGLSPERQPRLYTLSKRSAADEILHQLAEAERGTITLVAVGPMTNLALAYQKDPRTFARCKRVICMGGSVDNGGNVTVVAEFNWHACAHGVDTILRATLAENPEERIEFYMVPTDVTRTVPFKRDMFDHYIAPLDTPLAKLSVKVFTFLFKLMWERLSVDAMSLHDPLCLGFFVDLSNSGDDMEKMSRIGWSVTKDADIRIETEGRLTRGMVVWDRRKKHTKEIPGSASKTHVVLKADADRFLRTLLSDIWDIDYPFQK